MLTGILWPSEGPQDSTCIPLALDTPYLSRKPFLPWGSSGLRELFLLLRGNVLSSFSSPPSSQPPALTTGVYPDLCPASCSPPARTAQARLDPFLNQGGSESPSPERGHLLGSGPQIISLRLREARATPAASCLHLGLAWKPAA